MSGPRSAGASVDIELERPAVQPATRARPGDSTNPKRLPPHSVILHDDPINGFAFVVRTLKKVFRYNTAHAFLLTLRAHRTGRAAVWTGPKEHAELKAEQLKAAGPDPMMAIHGAAALGVSVEPVPQ